MTKPSRILSSYSPCRNRVCEPRMQNEDQNHTVARMHCAFGEASQKPWESLSANGQSCRYIRPRFE